MPLLPDERSDVLRHLGYEIEGLAQSNVSGGTLAYGGMGPRYASSWGFLAGRLLQLKPIEEAKITGKPYAAVGFTGDRPHAGDSVTVSLSGGPFSSPIVHTVTLPGGNAYNFRQFELFDLAYMLASAFAGDPLFTQTGLVAIADYGPGPFAETKIPVPICSFVAPRATAPYTISTSYTGQTPPQVMANAQPVSPYACLQGQKLYGFLPILNYLEGLYIGGAATVGFNSIKGASSEISYSMAQSDERQKILEQQKTALARFLGVPRNRTEEAGISIGY